MKFILVYLTLAATAFLLASCQNNKDQKKLLEQKDKQIETLKAINQFYFDKEVIEWKLEGLDGYGEIMDVLSIDNTIQEFYETFNQSEFSIYFIFPIESCNTCISAAIQEIKELLNGCDSNIQFNIMADFQSHKDLVIFTQGVEVNEISTYSIQNINPSIEELLMQYPIFFVVNRDGKIVMCNVFDINTIKNSIIYLSILKNRFFGCT
jgi:hypothetical protein